jgi:alpha-L-rhamnosidase
MDETGVGALRCEYRSDPLGLDVARPRLMWKLLTARRGARQTAYQVRVASTAQRLAAGEADLWDSGRVESDQSVHVAYAGAPLPSGQRAWWRVAVWDETGARAESEPASWEMGLLARGDWQGEWIGAALVGGPRTSVPCPYLRKEFRVEGPVAAARLYATALGLYALTLNGRRVGADELTPGWTDYATRVQYQTYDVTGLLRRGANAWGAILGDGWYCGHVGWFGRQRYGERPRLLAQLVLTYADRTRQTVVTDGTWKTAFGPLLQADLLMGESYDARQERTGWDEPGFADAGWAPAERFPDPGVALVAQRGPTVRRTQELTLPAAPVAAGAGPAAAYIADLGQNMVGTVRLKVKGPPGTTIRLRYAEALRDGPGAAPPGGGLYTESLRSALQTDFYTLKGDPAGEVWEPRFTFHGFRYVELTGWPAAEAGPPGRDALTGIVLHSDTPPTGAFRCSDPLVNQLQRNIDWGQRGNYVDVPTDCPQRDERLGWTGDAQVFVRTAAFNRDVAGFFTKWARDVADSQSARGAVPMFVPNSGLGGADGGPAWADAVLICPWTMYLCYGDARLLEEHYGTFVRFLDYLQATSQEGLRCYAGYQGFQGFGDWLALDGSAARDGATPKDLIGTAFYAHSARLLSRIAAVLGKEADAERYEALFRAVRAAFQRRFVTPAGLVTGGTQTAYVLALHFDLLPEALRAPAAEALVGDVRERGWRLSTGFVGSPYLPHVLTAAGRLDVAYRLLQQTAWPSWLYAVTQGATTIWERWDGWTRDRGYQTAAMNSFNHYAYGAVGAWLYQVVAGIEVDPARPGYQHAVLRPRPGGALTAAAGTLETVYGRLESDWHLDGGVFRWHVAVPPNATATVYVPAPGGAAVTLDGRPPEEVEGVTPGGRDDAGAVYEVGAGDYRFAAPYG